MNKKAITLSGDRRWVVAAPWLPPTTWSSSAAQWIVTSHTDWAHQMPDDDKFTATIYDALDRGESHFYSGGPDPY